MADLEFEDFDGDYDSTVSDGRLERAQRMVRLAGAVCSVALVLGLGFWGYRLAVRDVAGIPVMRALAGPMRVAPSDPGGDQASNQGLSVNAIAATGASGPIADQVTLAPRPVALQPGDTSGLANVSTPQVVPNANGVVAASLVLTGQASPGAVPAAATSNDIAPSAASSIVHSPRPRARPVTVAAGSATAAPQDVQAVSAPGSIIEIDPAKLAVGTRLAQLGAFDTVDLARAKFAGLQAQFGELMKGKAMVVQSAQSGGKTFYRLRAHGFANDDEARRFCAALQAENTDCIPVAQR